MTEKQIETSRPHRFTVVSVERTQAPAGTEGGNWYRYVIERNGSTIVGNRSGTRQQVSNHAEAFAEDLNSRLAGGGPSSWTPQQKKRAVYPAVQSQGESGSTATPHHGDSAAAG